MSKRRRISVAATGSVGATMAPSANATAHGRPSTRACTATATAVAVTATSTVEVSVMVRASARSSRRLAKNAAEYSSGGRNTTSTRSGSRRTSGTPGTNPRPRPPTTSRIGYGMPIRVASALMNATATRRLMMTASRWLIRARNHARPPPPGPKRPRRVAPMPARSQRPARAGETGPRRIGLGLAALGRPGYLNLGHGADLGHDRSVEALRARSFEVLDAAYGAGVRYLDAARS